MTEYKLWGADSELNLPALRKIADMMKPANAPLEFEIEVIASGFSAVSIVPARYGWTYDYFPKRRKISRKIAHNIARREARWRKKLAKKYANSFERHLDLVMIHGEKR